MDSGPNRNVMLALELLESDSDDEAQEALDAVMLQHIKRYYNKEPQHTSNLQGCEWVDELLDGHQDRIFGQFRMSGHCFLELCQHLLNRGYYHFDAHQKNSVEGSVAIFLKVVAANPNHRNAAERFQHSNATISHYVNKVCESLQLLATEIICPEDIGQTHSKIVEDRRFNPYFMKCCGAIDGTLIPVCAPQDEHNAFRSRHGNLCQNVLAVCDFNMRITFVSSGMEGSAHDARVLTNTVLRAGNHFPLPLVGWFYLGDSGYTNTLGFLTPHKNTRYHLHDWAGTHATPQTPNELFNRCHAALRNTVERTFGVLKKRFKILKDMPYYSPRTQAEIVIACCALHNCQSIKLPVPSNF